MNLGFAGDMAPGAEALIDATSKCGRRSVNCARLAGVFTMPDKISAHRATVARPHGLRGDTARLALFAEFSAIEMECVIGCLDTMRDY
jgi:hypothetical protein